MRITILGAGEVGTHLARTLAGDDHDVVVIDSDPEKVRQVREALDIEVLEGHGGDVGVLGRAIGKGADLFCAVTANDELNMLASLLAKKLGARQTAVRITGSSHISARHFFYRRTLDFDLTLSPEETAAEEISRQVRGQDFLAIETLADGKLQLQRLRLSGRFDASGERIRDVRLPRQCLIVALARDGGLMIPRGDDEMRDGDEVLVIGASETMERVHKILGGRDDLPKRVIIVGGGRAALAAASTLARLKIRVKILERSHRRCEELAELLPHCDVEHADGTNLEHLIEENAGKADLFLAMTDVDEVNLVSCQIARELGAKSTVATIWKPDYQTLYSKLGVDAVVAPRVLVADRIARFVKQGASARSTPIEGGRAEVLEIDVEPGSPIAGRALKDLGFPRGALVGAIVRQEDVMVPRGTDTIEVEDLLIVFALREVVEAVEALLG